MTTLKIHDREPGVDISKAISANGLILNPMLLKLWQDLRKMVTPDMVRYTMAYNLPPNTYLQEQKANIGEVVGVGFQRVWKDTADNGAENVAAALLLLMGAGGLSAASAIDDKIKQRAASWINDADALQTKAIMKIVDNCVNRGMNVDSTLSYLLPTIGLTPMAAGAVMRYMDNLLGPDWRAGDIPKNIERKIEGYADELREKRIDDIAITESSWAYNLGGLLLLGGAAALLGAKGDGKEAGKEFYKTWRVAAGPNMCNDCAAMEGVRVKLNETFSVPGYGEVDGPQVHARCQCSLEYTTEVL